MMGKILIVEDNPQSLELATDLLQAQGYTVIQATTGFEGWELAKAEQPDLILMDIQLPGMDGILVIGELKRDPSTQAIPIVAMTAHTMEGDAQRFFKAGVVGYLPKPLDTRAFTRLVAGSLEAKNPASPGP